MEPSGQCTLDNSLNPEIAVGDTGKIEIHTSASSSHNEEQVIGYIEISEDGVGVDVQYVGDGDDLLADNEIILFVSEQDGGSSEQSSGILSVENIKSGIVGHEMGPGEIIETEEVSHNCANREIFIDNSQYPQLIAEESENPDLGEEIQSAQSSQEKEEDTEVLIVPTSSDMSSSQIALITSCEAQKHRKLMQLAFIAQQLQSADQKTNFNTSIDSDKDLECSPHIPEDSVIITQQHIEDNSDATTLLLPNGSESTKVDETDESMPESTTENECQINNVNLDSEINSNNASTYLCYETTRTTGNAISVIHTATSELLESVPESNLVKQSCASDDLKSNCEIESDKGGSMGIVTNVSLRGKHQDSTFEQIIIKDSYEALPQQDQSNTPSIIADSSMNNKESDIPQSLPSEMNCSPDVDDETSQSLLENHEKLRADSVDLEGEKYLCSDADAYEMEQMDEYSHSSSRESCIVVVERDESKINEDESNFSASNLECTPMEDDVVMTDTAEEVTEDKCVPSWKSNSNTYVYPSDICIKNSGDFTNGENTCDSENKPCQTNDEYSLHSCVPIDDKENFEHSIFCSQKHSSLPASCKSSIFSTSKKIDDSSEETIQKCGSDVNVNVNLCGKISNSAECRNLDFVSNNTVDEISDMEICESNNDEREEDQNFSLKTALISTIDKTNKTINENFGKLRNSRAISRNNDNVFEISDSDKEHVTELTGKEIKSDEPKPNLECVSKKLTEVQDIQLYKPSLSSTNEDSNIVTCEETLVKPPKKTYIRKRKGDRNAVLDDKSNSKDKIELFSEDIAYNTCNCHKEICETVSEINVCQETSQESGDHLDDSDLKVSAVSTTYVTKKKPKTVPPIVREIRTRSLRPRSKGSKESLENESEDVSLIESKSKDSLSASNTESICWGDYLMKTSFENTTEMENTTDSPCSPKLNMPSKATLRIPSIRKRGRPKRMKTSIRSKLVWDRLIRSSPSKLKREFINKRKLREKVKKQFMSHLNSKSFISRQLLTPISLHSIGTVRKRGRPKPIMEKCVKSVMKNKKKAALIKDFTTAKYKNVSLDSSEQSNEVSTEYSCIHCSFRTTRINNLLLHMKFCLHKQTPMEFIDCRFDDMDRRQRIRGDDSVENSRTKDKAKSSGSLNGSIDDDMRDDDDEPQCSGFSQDHSDDSDEDETGKDKREKKTFGFSEDDIVWTKVSGVFWPGLVVELKKRKALVLLINSPFEKAGIKVRLNRLHTYDDVMWNRRILKKSEALAFYDKFVKAVQKAESFVRRKWLSANVRGREYFKFAHDVNFVSESEESDNCVNDDSDDDFDSQDQNSNHANDDIDEKEIVKIIKEGRCNVYLQNIFTRQIDSERHKTYFTKDRLVLSEQNWFGPLHDHQLRDEIYDYLQELFKTHVGDMPYSVTYIYQVWIPEAIKKAVALLKAIDLNEAEDLINMINSRCTDTADTEMDIEDIEKLYE